MKTSIWTYPWDLDDRGPERAAGEIAATGLQAVSLAATYHTFDQLRPGAAGGHLLTSDRSAAYYPCDPDAFSGRPLVPHRSEWFSGDRWAACARAARDAGLSVVAWTLFLHNSHLAARHPEAAQRTCTGDRLRHHLCPAQPDVRHYARCLAADICRLETVDVLECESIAFGAWGHAHYHPKVGVDLGPGGRFLFSLCFCDACVETAKRKGADADALRRRSRERIHAIFSTGEPLTGAPEDLVAADPDLGPFVAARDDTVTTLIREVSESAGKPLRVLAMGDRLTTGLDVSSVTPSVDVVEYLCYTPDVDRIRRTLDRAEDETGDIGRVGAGLQAYPPASESASDLAAAVATARDRGVGVVSFYNYGIMPRRNLDWIRQALSR